MPRLHQFLAGYSKGDAISNEARVFRHAFRQWGFDSEIYCEGRRILPELRKDARDVSDYRADVRADDVILLHLSIASPLNELFAELPCRKAILYHNVTPAHYFHAINPETARYLERGREQIRRLAGCADVNLADSAYNAHELTEAGYSGVAVLPLAIDFRSLRAAPDRQILKQLAGPTATVLFVGRCAPNKGIEHLLRTFSCFQKTVEPDSQFIHVGSYAGTERYHALLLAETRELGINRAYFVGSVIQSRLNAYYQGADLFVCMSEHEGFCIPVLESMVYDLPVLAFAAGAVPETLDGAGILFREKDPALIAEMMGEILHENGFRARLIEGQRARLARYEARDLLAELRTHLAPLLS
ncbi:MAG: glycosyltransferase [Lentisphaerae bacterium]|nr:glycosyltransferase [Lentisphaerota bacterium]